MFQAQGAERASGCPPPPSRMQKAICYNSDRLASPAWEMDVAFWNLYHPKGKCLLNHGEPGESRGRRCRGLVTLQRQGPKGGTTPGHGTSPCHGCHGLPSLGKASGRRRGRWRCLSGLDARWGACLRSRARAYIHTHMHARAHANPVHPQVLLKPLPAPSLPCFWPPSSPLDSCQDLHLIKSSRMCPSSCPPTPPPSLKEVSGAHGLE